MKRFLLIVIGGLIGLLISLLIFDDVEKIMTYVFIYILIGSIVFYRGKSKEKGN